MNPISSKALFHAPSSSLFQRRIFIPLFSTSHFPSSKRHEELRNVRVSMWWDFENCNVPGGGNVFKVAHTITAVIRANGMKGPVTITAFGDVFQLSRSTQEALSSTGINIAHVPRGGRNSADRSLLVDLMYWVSQNPPPAHLFLISGDRDFASTLYCLRMNNYSILLASPETAPGFFAMLQVSCGIGILWFEDRTSLESILIILPMVLTVLGMAIIRCLLKILSLPLNSQQVQILKEPLILLQILSFNQYLRQL